MAVRVGAGGTKCGANGRRRHGRGGGRPSRRSDRPGRTRFAPPVEQCPHDFRTAPQALDAVSMPTCSPASTTPDCCATPACSPGARSACWLLNVWLDPTLLAPDAEGPPTLQVLRWLSVYLTFGVVYWWITRPLGQRRPGIVDHVPAAGADRLRDRRQLLLRYRPGQHPADGRGRAAAVAAAGAVRPGLADLRQRRDRPGVRRRAGLPADPGGAAVAAVHGLLQLRLRHRAGRPPAGRGARGAAPAQRRTARHPRPAGRERPRQRAHPHLARAARPARPPPDRAEPEPGSGRPPVRGPGPGARAAGAHPGPAAADRRARGGQPAARRRRDRPGRGVAAAGRERARRSTSTWTSRRR